MKNHLDRWLARHPVPDKATSTREERRDYFDSMPEAVRREWEIRKAAEDANDPMLHNATAERARKRMARVDALPPGMRQVVHEYGLEIVQEFLTHRVGDPAAIRRMVEAVRLNGYDSGRTFMNCGVRQAKSIRHLGPYLCTSTRRACNPARDHCRCWWLSENPEHWQRLAAIKIASVEQQGGSK